MASLKKKVVEYADELREGIANVAFWKDGRSWNAEVFWLDGQDERYEIEKIVEILSIDQHAIIVNGYENCPFTMGDGEESASSIDFMLAHIKRRYDFGFCQLIRLMDDKWEEYEQW